MKKTALVLIIITILSKIFGFGREIVLAHFYGASNVSDAYIIALTIPTTFFVLIGRGVATSYIPIYTSIEKNSNIEEADRFTGNLINIIMIISTFMVLLGIVFTKESIMIFASGFEGNTLELAIDFTRISIFSIYLTSLVNIFKPYLEIKGNYSTPALIGLPMSLVIIISIVLSSFYGLKILSIGIVISSFVQLLLLLPFVKRYKYDHKKIINFLDSNIKKMVILSIPVFIGVAVNDINVIVDKTLASQISSGGISALNYAQTIDYFIQGTIVMSIATVMYPAMSKMVAENDVQSLKKVLSESITGTNLLVIPSSVGAMLLNKPIVELIFGRGAFDSEAVKITATALFFYSIGMLGKGLRQVLSRPFYAMQDTKTPMVNATIGVIVNIVLNIVLSKYLGIGGLALATSISAIFISILLLISLRKKIGPFGMKQISISFLKILLASLVMGGLAKLSFNYLTASLSQNLSLIIAIGVGAISYFVIIYFMKIEDVDVIVGVIKKKLGRDAA